MITLLILVFVCALRRKGEKRRGQTTVVEAEQRPLPPPPKSEEEEEEQKGRRLNAECNPDTIQITWVTMQKCHWCQNTQFCIV